MNCWLVKSEPDDFSIDDMKKAGREPWNGIRNYQARNFMRDGMKEGDLVLFYHSNIKPPGIVGLVRVVSAPYPDATQFDPSSKYFDPKAKKEDPRWVLRDMEFIAKFDTFLPLGQLKDDPKLDEMLILRKGSRLSITPVEAKHFKHICKLAGWKG